MTRAMRFYVSVPRGLGDLLNAEIAALVSGAVQRVATGVRFEGDLADAYRVCLWSRLANRVLMPVAQFPAPSAEALYAGTLGIRWEDHLAAEGTLAVDCTAVRSPIAHTRYAALKVKDAICDRFRDRTGVRPSVDANRPQVRIHVHLQGQQAEVSLDLAGTSLHQRGYRTDSGEAPLKENLAAALLLFADWPVVAAAGGTLLDPACGSGTILIEGALMAGDIAPGLFRDYFGFRGWRGHDAEVWAELVRAARARQAAGIATLPPIVGYDSDAEVVATAQRNLERAGLGGQVSVTVGRLEDRSRWPSAGQGLVLTNPPYGERLGELAALRPLYARLGERLRAEAPGWRAAVFTGNAELAAYIGLPVQCEHTLFNGPLECRLFQYAVPAPEDGTAAGEGAEAFANRLRKNLKHLGRWARREGIDCYRLYDADLPEFALAVDLYHGVDPRGPGRWVHVQEYEAPASVDPQQARRRLQAALAVVSTVLEVDMARLYLKTRRRQRGREQYQAQGSSARFLEVQEGGCRLLVNLGDYLDTGLFLDHRITRGLIRELAAGRRFLNLFCYTGAATVYAALGRARATTSVDLSKTYLEWAGRNLALNGLRGPEHELIQSDCLTWLEQEAARGVRRYGLIFLDPPTFSNSKRMDGTLDVQRDQVTLIRHALALLEPDGVLLFSTNNRRFKLDATALADLEIEDITRLTLPADFARNPRIHRCWRIRRAAR